FNGYALANASPVASVSYGYAAQEAYPYDPARAKALLGGGGFCDTNPPHLQLLFPAKHYGQSFDEMTPAVAEMLKDVGVQVTLKPVDFATLLQTASKGTLPPNGGVPASPTGNQLA